MATSLMQLIIAFLVYGYCFGFFETGCNLVMIHLWNKSADPFMQSMQFAFGLGSLIAPLAAAPFLSPEGGTDTESLIIYPYCALAVIILINGMSFLFWFKYSRSEDVKGDVYDDIKSQDITSNELIDRSQSSKIWSRIVISVVLLFMHIYVGIEMTIGSYIATYVVQSGLHMTKVAGADLTTLFWASFTIAKLAAIPTVRYLGNEKTISVSLIFMLASSVMLVIFGQTSVPLLVLGIVLMGVGLASIFGCVYTFLNNYRILSSRIASWVVILAVLAEVSFPAFISLFIDSNPAALMWVALVSSCCQSFLFLIAVTICHTKLA